MKRDDKKEGSQTRIGNIEFDLNNFKILLHFRNNKNPLVIHFDKPGRRFYFSLIALIANEMKNFDKPEYVHIRKHEKILRLLDRSLTAEKASKTVESMWDKIRKAWRYTLPDLEAGAHFKVEGRNLVRPYERGGKFRYDCSEGESDVWANLFDYHENNPWRFKFAVDSGSLNLSDISMVLGELRNSLAWQEFVRRLSVQTRAMNGEKLPVPRRSKQAALAFIAIFIVGASTWTTWNLLIRPVPPTVDLALSNKPSVAVLPFINLSGDPAQEYFSDGLTEEIITELGSVPNLLVIARNSTFTYKGKPVKVQQVSKDLGVRYVLEGSVRRSGNRVRISAQLIDARNGLHIWAEQYDRHLKDIFAVQDEITKAIITAMQVELTEGEQARGPARGTNNLTAYLKCLQANELIHRINIESNALAKRLAEEAIALDPNYAWAYYNLGRSHQQDVWLGVSESPEESISKAMELVQKAVSLDDSLAEAHGRLGFLLVMRGQYDEAIAEAEKGVTMNPNSAMAHVLLGKTLSFAGMWNESIPLYKKAILLDPIPPNFPLYSLGLSYAYTGLYEDAIKWCERAIRQEPDSLYAHIMMTVVYGFSGRHEEAQAEASEVLRIQPRFSLEEFQKKLTYRKENDRERFLDALRMAGLE